MMLDGFRSGRFGGILTICAGLICLSAAGFVGWQSLMLGWRGVTTTGRHLRSEWQTVGTSGGPYPAYPGALHPSTRTEMVSIVGFETAAGEPIEIATDLSPSQRRQSLTIRYDPEYPAVNARIEQLHSSAPTWGLVVSGIVLLVAGWMWMLSEDAN